MDIKEMSHKDIKSYLDSINQQESIELIPILLKDERKTVRKLAVSIQNNYNKYLQEKKRVLKMMEFEKSLIKEGFTTIAGVDEVGRGPLAGPVVAAAVVLPNNVHIENINDSKKLSQKKREELFDIISEISIDMGIGIVDNKIIDEINILNATKLAMKHAINSLVRKPDYILIDALHLADINIKQKSIIKGDSRSISIAASSIIAKVTRDRLIEKYSEVYPGYGFEKHKGYGTKEHYDAIERYGITDIHRKSFLKNIEFI